MYYYPGPILEYRSLSSNLITPLPISMNNILIRGNTDKCNNELPMEAIWVNSMYNVIETKSLHPSTEFGQKLTYSNWKTRKRISDHIMQGQRTLYNVSFSYNYFPVRNKRLDMCVKFKPFSNLHALIRFLRFFYLSILYRNSWFKSKKGTY